MKCPSCNNDMEIEKRQAALGDLTCCRERNGYGKPCKQIGHKNWVCNKCKILSGRVKE